MTNFNPEWLLRIALASLIGALIGYERYSQSKEAGVRTHAVVALASSLLMIISQFGFGDMERYDAARIAAQAVSGIGFLGAGIIFFQHGTIQGLTTAAGMWTTSAIGLAIGAGMYVIGIFSAFLVYFIQSYLYKMFPYFAPRSSFGLLITFKRDGNLDVINTTMKRTQYSHAENRISADENGNWTIRTEVTAHDQLNPKSLIEEFEKNPDIISVKII